MDLLYAFLLTLAPYVAGIITCLASCLTLGTWVYHRMWRRDCLIDVRPTDDTRQHFVIANLSIQTVLILHVYGSGVTYQPQCVLPRALAPSQEIAFMDCEDIDYGSIIVEYYSYRDPKIVHIQQFVLRNSVNYSILATRDSIITNFRKRKRRMYHVGKPLFAQTWNHKTVNIKSVYPFVVEELEQHGYAALHFTAPQCTPRTPVEFWNADNHRKTLAVGKNYDN